MLFISWQSNYSLIQYFTGSPTLEVLCRVAVHLVSSIYLVWLVGRKTHQGTLFSESTSHWISFDGLGPVFKESWHLKCALIHQRLSFNMSIAVIWEMKKFPVDKFFKSSFCVFVNEPALPQETQLRLFYWKTAKMRLSWGTWLRTLWFQNLDHHWPGFVYLSSQGFTSR